MEAMRKRFRSGITRRNFMRTGLKVMATLPFAGIVWNWIFKLPARSAAASEAAGSTATGAGSPQIKVGGSSSRRLLLKNGLIVDGTGKAPYTGDLLIAGKQIEAVARGQIEVECAQVDCSGKVVAPGFIDVHSHMDWVLPVQGYEQLKLPFIRQGVTTFVAGNCGHGVAGFKKNSRYKTMLSNRASGLYAMDWDSMDEYFQYVKKHGMSHNLLNLAGHGTTRTSIQGFDETPLEAERMKELLFLLEEAMDQGAHGVSFGLQYEPGVFATLDELKQIARLVKSKDKIITTHMKAYSALSGTYPLKFYGTPHNLLAIEDMLNIARETGVKMQLSHLIFVGERTWKNFEQAIGMIDRAIQEGLDVQFDTYAYHCGTSVINVVLPEWFLAGIPEVFASRTALLKLRAELTLIKNLLGFGYEDIQITKADHPELEQYNGMFLRDIARQRALGEFENFIDFVKKSNGRAAVLNHRYSTAAQVKAMILHPAALIQTDAVPALEGTQNPAAFGNFPRVLQYARDDHLLSLQAVVRKMTGAAADRFNIRDRGYLKETYAADITVFDWQKVKDNNTDAKTDQNPDGIEMVFINGHPVLNQQKTDLSVMPGVVL